MSENSPSNKKGKPHIDYPKITSRNVVEPPDPLPFSLQNRSVIEAMSFLGISPDEITALPFQHFLKTEKDEPHAISAYQCHISIRSDLIQQIQETRKNIQEQKNPKQSPDVIYEKKLVNRDQKMLKTKLDNNKQILKTIALKQLRQAHKIQQGEEKIQYQQRISNEHDEKLHQKLNEAQENKEKNFSSSQKVDTQKNDTFSNKSEMLKKSENESEKRILFVTQQKKQKLEERATKNNEKIKETIERQNRQFTDKIAQMQQRLNKNDEVMSSIPQKLQQRDEKLTQKATLRNERSKSVEKRNIEYLTQKVGKVERLLQTEQVNFEKVMSTNRKETEQKIGKESDLLKKRNEAAERIFNRQREELEKYKCKLEERDNMIRKNQDDLQKERMEKLHQNKINRENKTAAVKRSQRARDCATAFYLRKRITWSDDGLNDLQNQRAKSQLARAKASETFASQMSETAGMLPRIVALNDEQKVQELIRILGISEEEAKELVSAAKYRTSLH